jgi:ParB family chromosome partitioning protein
MDAEAAHAFTLAPIKDQAAALKKLRKGHGKHRLSEYSVRNVLVGDDRDLPNLLKIVGRKAYEAAGGSIIEDLFKEKHVVSDPALVKKLADEKLDAKAKELVEKDGWGWAYVSGKSPLPSYSYISAASAPKLNADETKLVKSLRAEQQKLYDVEPEDATFDESEERIEAIDAEVDAINEKAAARAMTPENRKKLGCIVEVSRDGKIEVRSGLMEPRALAAEKRKATKAAVAKGDKAGISNALMTRLSNQLNDAVAFCLENDPDLALRSLVAALGADIGYDSLSPVRVSVEGYRFKRGEFEGSRKGLESNFETLLASALKYDAKKLARTLAGLVATCVNIHTLSADHPPFKDEGTVAMCAAIKPKAFEEAVRKFFDADDYFTSASRDVALAALEEMGRKGQASGVKGAKKDHVAKVAAEAAKKDGWVPRELRLVSAKPTKAARSPKALSKRLGLPAVAIKRGLEKRKAKIAKAKRPAKRSK